MADRAAVVVREYTERKGFDRDARKLSEDGYAVVSVTEQTRRSGCVRIILLGGIGALIWKPKPRLIVTYRLTPISEGEGSASR